ncbi:hypothetical protein PVT71_26770 (plasmid) [Salipiger sp. H15]|uniref:Uncharacterized protein n=1 Tax=Alloyangia sp. H15 TaxID=3029062 RepID=A0AAU8ASR8_9RHOB
MRYSAVRLVKTPISSERISSSGTMVKLVTVMAMLRWRPCRSSTESKAARESPVELTTRCE